MSNIEAQREAPFGGFDPELVTTVSETIEREAPKSLSSQW